MYVSRRHTKKDVAEDDVENSVDELCKLFGDDSTIFSGKNGLGSGKWKKQTKQLVDSLADEITRMIEFEEKEEENKQVNGENEPSTDEEGLVPPEEKDAVATDTQSSEFVVSDAQPSDNADNQSSEDAVAADTETPKSEGVGQDDISDCGDSVLSYLSLEEDGVVENKTSIEGCNTPISPFTIWRRANWKEVPAKQKLELTEKGWGTLVDRLCTYKKDKELAMMKAQHRVLSEQLATLKFSPDINKNSKKMANNPPLQQRLEYIISSKKERLANERKRLLAEQDAECTGVPRTNNSKRWKPKIAYKYSEQTAVEAQVNDVELTFAPKINRKSSILAERASRSGRRRELKVKKHTPRIKHPVQSVDDIESTFQPKINDRSKSLSRGQGEKVHERLYGLHKQQHQHSNGDINTKTGPNIINYDAERHSFILGTLHRLDSQTR